MKRRRGRLIVVSAPSGAGKSTLCRRLVQDTPGLEFSVSFTTRAPRPGEVDGEDYFFIDEQKFRLMAGNGEFLEWAEVHGNLYGTSAARVNEALDAGSDVLLDVDVQGARRIRQDHPDGVFVFILPPSLSVLRERLSGRGSDTEEVIKRRLGNALGEIREFLLYDYVIVNDKLDEALKELEAVVLASRLRADSVDPSWIESNFFGQEEV